jgi:nitrite reductase/ring-hydroxylating ferredoxin subunit
MNDLSNATSKAVGGYNGYSLRSSADFDAELTKVGPGSPGGEYLRRFWHPVALEKDVGELPGVVQVLSETLVLFRDKSGRFGLVHRNCPHRLASLEYGMCEDKGIRCCYHGWKFDIDGTILDVPGQPVAAADRIKKNLQLGAYPVKSFKGLLFAYLGPREHQPPFPIFDAYKIPEMEMVPYVAPFHCNWLQVLDAILDPIHTSFLHSRVSRVQFSKQLGELGEMAFYERNSRFLGTNTRRVGDNVWVRVNEMILPNFTQAGAAFATDGTTPRYFGRSSFTRWVVPINDTESMAIGWANFGNRGDPVKWNTPEGLQLIEQGELFDRPYEDRQRFPADSEAVEGMGPITAHRNEHLAPSDKGILLMRNRLRTEIRAVTQGKSPILPTDLASDPIPTYGGDTVLRLPPKNGRDDRSFLQATAKAVLQAQYDADARKGNDRDAQVCSMLERIESAETV